MTTRDRSPQRGQVLALFALALTAIVLGAAVVVDGGFAFAQRRATQNAADFAAMAGTRIVGQKLTGNPPGSGTAANVRDAIDSVLAANAASLVQAQYVDEEGAALGDVQTASSIPTGAFGVVVQATTDWKPFLLGVIGVTDWAANASATAITPGKSLGGGVMPVGIEDFHYDDLDACEVTNLDGCLDQPLTPGTLIEPGNFGWLAFGLGSGQGKKCDFGASLGMIAGGCDPNKPFIQGTIGPPSNSYGCCTAVGLPGSADLINGLPGNKVSIDLSFYIDNQIPVWVPIYDWTNPGGSHSEFHIVGFGAIVFTDEQGGKDLKGAAISGACAPGTEIEGHAYCNAPGGSFTIDVTGEVQLIR
jgi:hypothetical protein